MIKNGDEKVYENCSGNYCIKTYQKNNLVKETWYDKQKRVHRNFDLPACITYTNAKNVYSYEWYQRNKLHRENDLPARIIYSSKAISCQKWYTHGFLHRENGPAIISKTKQEWWKYNVCKKIITKVVYYIMLQLHKYRKYANLNPINKSWYNSKILEPKLIKIIISYTEKIYY